ncbi:thiamine pyrophosphate-binding protein [Nonomuraea sp. NPDC003707]
MRLPCWDALARTLADAGCRAVFGLPSDEPGLLDAAARLPGPTVHVISDQRIAACAAAGYAMTTRSPAVLALTSGPSFANAVPGLLEAASLGTPIVAVTTRVPAERLGRGAFQQLDQRGLIASLAAWHHVVETPRQLTWAARRAVARALDGRGGLAVLEIAAEVAESEADVPDQAWGPVRAAVSRPDEAALDAAADLLIASARPVIVAGGGMRWSAAAGGQTLVRLAEELGAPVFTTAAGRGAVDERHPRAFGLAGLYTTPPADRLFAEADVALVLGSALEETVQMGWPALERTRIVHVDRDPYALGMVVEPHVGLVGDAGLACGELLRRLTAARRSPRGEWLAVQERVARVQQAWADAGYAESPVRAAIRAVQTRLGRPSVIVQENGLHDMWSYHYPVLEVAESTAVVCPGEQTMMGYGVAAAAGAALGAPAGGPGGDTAGGPVVVFCGDGALRLSVGALAVLAEHALGVVLVVFDNGGFGWPRHLRAKLAAPDELTRFARPLSIPDLAAAFGGWGCEVDGERDLEQALDQAGKHAAAGTFAVVRIPAPDHDVPAGVIAHAGEADLTEVSS